MIIRFLLGAAMCVGVYKETGIYTTIFAGTVMLYIEVSDWNFKLLRDQVIMIIKVLDKHFNPDTAIKIPLSEEEQAGLLEKFKAEAKEKGGEGEASK